MLRGALRRSALTLHVTVSVGWLGAVLAFLALAIAAWRTSDPALVRGGLQVMDVTGRWVLLPLSLLCLITGVTQGLGTEWGIARHYWVLATLIINVVATVVLVLFLGDLRTLTAQATAPDAGDAALLRLRDPAPAVHAAAALLVLVLATALSVVKPRGRTRHGQRVLARQRAAAGPG